MDREKIENLANIIATWITISATKDIRSIQLSVNNGQFDLKDRQYKISEDNAMMGIFELTLLYLYLADMYFLTQRASGDRLTIINEVQEKLFKMMESNQVSVNKIVDIYATRAKFFYQYKTLINEPSQGLAGSLLWEFGDIFTKKMTNSSESVSPFLIQALQSTAVRSLGQLAAFKTT